MANTSTTLLQRLNDRSDSVAWQRLVHLYSPLIKAWLRQHGVSASDTEDFAQDVLVVVIREVARFQHNGRVGAFRTWLRVITANCLRQSLRSRRDQLEAANPLDFVTLLDQLDDPTSDLSRRWDREHDRYVLDRLLQLIEPDFEATTWQAFRRQVIDGEPAKAVAAELCMTVNAVLIAKSRVLSHLRREADGLVD
jgi:RNA polymerase sigma-70 factor, ECF subfamily